MMPARKPNSLGMRLLLLLALLPLSAWGASVTGKLSAERVEAGSILTY
jgi:hypothetical protein